MGASRTTESSPFEPVACQPNAIRIAGSATLASPVITITIIMPFSAILSNNNVDLPAH